MFVAQIKKTLCACAVHKNPGVEESFDPGVIIFEKLLVEGGLNIPFPGGVDHQVMVGNVRPRIKGILVICRHLHLRWNR